MIMINKTNLKHNGYILFILLLLFALTFMPLCVHAEPTDNCTGDCPHEAMIGTMHYDTLVDAVDAANDGDTIELLKDVELNKLSGNRTDDSATSDTDGILRFDQPGTYTILGNGHTITRSDDTTYAYKNVIFTKNGAVVNLGSKTEPEKSRLVIDGKEQYSTNALLIAHDNGTINMYAGVTVRNSNGHGGTGAAGIVVYGTFNMYGGTVENNQSKMMGGGISLPPWQSEATAVLNVYGGIFRNNRATGEWGNDFGGAIANFNGKSVHIENAVFEENSAQYGGAIYSGTTLDMKNCIFKNNNAIESGGALYATGSVSVAGSAFTQNQANRGGAIGLLECDLTVDDQSVIYENKATTAGDDITIDNDTAHTVKLPTGKSMTATGKMTPFRASGWFEDGRQGQRFDAIEHAEEAIKLDYQQEVWQADLKAAYTAEDCLLTFDPNGGNWDGNGSNKTFVVVKDQNFIIIETPVREGYRFLYWKGQDSVYQPGDTYVVEGDHTFIAEWESNDIPNIEIPVYPNQTTAVTVVVPVETLPLHNIGMPLHPNQTTVETVVESMETLPQPTRQVVVMPTTPSPNVYALPATGSVETSLILWTGLGLALVGFFLKRRG